LVLVNQRLAGVTQWVLVEVDVIAQTCRHVHVHLRGREGKVKGFRWLEREDRIAEKRRKGQRGKEKREQRRDRGKKRIEEREVDRVK
jgi:diadenosine tetraphosphate (Ap4A) HIT family hydrolase